jgi:hypothetical protein
MHADVPFHWLRDSLKSANNRLRRLSFSLFHSAFSRFFINQNALKVAAFIVSEASDNFRFKITVLTDGLLNIPRVDWTALGYCPE